MLIDEWIDWREIVTSLNCISLHVHDVLLTEARVRQVKESGLLLLSYTVNDVKRAEELYSWGVDAVFSDYPDRIARLI